MVNRVVLVAAVLCVLATTLFINTVQAQEEDAVLMEIDEGADTPSYIHLRRNGRSSIESDDSSLLELSAKPRRVRRGWGISRSARTAKRVQQRLPAPRLTGAASTLTRANVRCVLCQFIVQKIKKQLLPDSGKSDDSSLLEIGATTDASAEENARIATIIAADAAADAAVAVSYPNQQGVPNLFENGPVASQQYRHDAILSKRPLEARFMQTKSRKKLGAEAHADFLDLYTKVYASFEGLCSKKMPLAYLPYCNDMLQSYRFFAQGLSYGDRPEQICMNGNFCDHRAYVRTITHNAYQREPGDA